MATGNEVDLLQTMNTKLDQLVRLSALQITSGMKQTPAIQRLSAAGLDRKTIAELLDTTPNTVSVTLAKAKAKAAKSAESQEPETTEPVAAQ